MKQGEIVKLREQGKTCQEIGDKFGVSRQRIHQILSDKYKAYQQSDKFKAYRRKYQQSDKYKAYRREYYQRKKI